MLQANALFGKYRIRRRLARGGFAEVYRAYDTIEGIDVALKIADRSKLTPADLEVFRREARMVAALDHPSILPIKSADWIDDKFVLASPLAVESLDARMRRRFSTEQALAWLDQILAALSYAHARKIVHCDVKPDNILLFAESRLRLADFGIAKVALRTLDGAGTGTVGFCAPEQAMGYPTLASDVFSFGVIAWRLLSGHLPHWPFDWPFEGRKRLIARTHVEFAELLRRCLSVDPRGRPADAVKLQAAWKRAAGKMRAARTLRSRRVRAAQPATTRWPKVMHREFLARFGKSVPCRDSCRHCGGPVAEAMHHCPWCGVDRKRHEGDTDFPSRCERCDRGLKADWRYCPWCWGPGRELKSTREFDDRRYIARCTAPACKKKRLMTFMRYCPTCHAKVKRPWALAGVPGRCSGCGWVRFGDYWTHCPWCGKNGGRG